MASLTLAAKVSEVGNVIVPEEAIGALGLRPGDDIKIQIEGVAAGAEADNAVQADLRQKLTSRLDEAHTLKREPFTPFTDPLEAEWAKGVEEKARRMGLKLTIDSDFYIYQRHGSEPFEVVP